MVCLKNTLLYMGRLLMTPALVSSHNPFKMLDSFTESDRGAFFGREEDGRQLVRATINFHATLLLGESGVGKTSLIDVALMRPLLARDDLFVIETTCGPDLLDRFSHSLRTLLDENWQRWFKELKQVTWESLTEFLRAFTIERNHNVVLIFDGLEALFCSTFSEQDRKQFFQFLSMIEVGNDRMHVLASLDSAYLADLYRYAKMVPALLANTLLLERLSWDQARHAIDEPFTAAGFALEAGLSRKIYEDTVRLADDGQKRPRTTDLQWVCGLFFEVVASEDRPPTIDRYRQCGGAAGLIQTYFKELFGLPESERRFLSELLLARLVLPGFTISELNKQKILWIFSGVEASEEQLEGVLRDWSAARFLRFDADSNTYRLRHAVLKNHMDRFLGLSARLTRLKLELSQRARGRAGEVFEFSLHKLEPYFRYRKVLMWTPDELRTIYFSALKQGFPAYWWETLLRRKLGDRGFLEVLTHEFGECDQPQLMQGICGQLAMLDPKSFDSTAGNFDKQVLRLAASTQQPASVRAALLNLARAWNMAPQNKHYQLYLFVEERLELRLAFFAWVAACATLDEVALLKKWHDMVEGQDALGDGENQAVVTHMVALLQRYDEGIEALGEVLMLQEDGDTHLNINLVLPLLAGFPGIDPDTLHQYCLRAFDQQIAHRRDLHAPGRELVIDFLKEHASDDLFSDIWGRLSETYPLTDDILDLAVALVGEQHYPLLMMSLYDEDDIIRHNAKRLLLALGTPPSLIALDSPIPIDEKPWEARAVLLRCYLAHGDAGDLPEGFQSPAQLESNTEVLWAQEYLTAYFESRPPQAEWVSMLEQFGERLAARNQALLPELKLLDMQDWAGKAWRRIGGHWRRGLSAITKQSAVLFGENAKEDIRLRLAKMRAAMQDWVSGAQRVYGTLDQNRAVTMRLILKKLGNLLKSLDEKHEQFEGYCRRIDLAPLANRHLRSFLESELIGFWELHAQNLHFLHERLRAPGETEDSVTWTQLVADFGAIVDQSAADIEFWRDCLPQLRDRETLECLLLNHRGFLQVRRTMLSCLSEAGGEEPWVRDYLMAQFGKTKTEFDDLEWRTIIKGLAGSRESELADRLSLAIQTHKGLEPQILEALCNMGSLELVDDEQLSAILLHPKKEIREAVIPILVKARPDLLRRNADRMIQIGEESTIYLLLEALAEIGTVAELRLFLGHRGLLVNGLWVATQKTMGAVMQKTVSADKRWFESGGLKSLQGG